MAQTLEEFLISVKYNINQPSQDTFFNAMKRAATSVAGVAGELTGLGVAVLKISEIMATAGEKLYWMSQRVGDSVTEIQGMAFAMSNLGISAGEATAGIERFGAWTRSMGPAATGYLRSLGVTATDTIGRMQQLGSYFRTHGGTADQQGTLEYSLALRRWQMMGGDERSMLALSSGQMERNLQQAGMMQRLVWGKDWQTGPQQFAAQSVAVMNQFRLMGFFFENLKDKFALGLFNAIEQPLKDINTQLQAMLPHIQTFLDHIVSYAPAALHFLQGVMKAFDFLIQLTTVAMDTFDKLPGSVETMIGALLAMPAALRLIGLPLFWILGGLTSLLLLLDDYQHWKDDQEHPGQKTSYFDWGSLDKIAQPLIKMHDDINRFICDLTGIHHGLDLIAGMAVGLMGVATALKAIGAAAALAAGGKLSGIIARFGFAARWGLPLAAAIGAAGAIHEAELPENVALAKSLFGDDSATSLGKALIAKSMGDMAGLSPEDWIKRNMPGWLNKTSETPAAKPQAGSDAKPPDFSDWPNPDAPAPRVDRQWNLGDTIIGRAIHRLLEDWPWVPADRRGDTRSKNPGIGGQYQLASFGGIGGSGADEFFTPERFYALFLFSFQTMTEKLSDILKTLTDMAEGQGAPHTARGGGGGDDSDVDLLPPGASTDAQEAKLREIEQRELGGRNILNRQGPGGSPASSASGFYQMIDGTWLHAARLAGIDTNRYPRAIDAPHDVQHRAALALMNEQGERPWLASAPHLGHVPLGGGAAAGGGGGGAARSNSGGVHNQTTIHMTAPNPSLAAAQVVEAQNRVFEHHIRFAKGALLA